MSNGALLRRMMPNGRMENPDFFSLGLDGGFHMDADASSYEQSGLG